MTESFDVICRATGEITSIERLTDAGEQILDLVLVVEDLNLDTGISNSLDAKLQNAVKALEDLNENNDGAAINKLEAFINAVEARAGDQISQEDADALIATAQQIIDMLSG